MNKTPEFALQCFKQQFPDIAITALHYNEGGEHYIVDINNTWICKVSKEKTPSKLIETEAALLRLLQGKLKTSIPTVEYYEPGFLVYKKIPGTELTKEWYETLTPNEQQALANDIASFLHELHAAISVAQAQEIGIAYNNWPWHAAQLKQNAHYLNDADLQKMFEFFIGLYDHAEQNKQFALLHNDMILRNIIVNPTTKAFSGIIDFTDTAIDDFYVDLRLNYLCIPALSRAVAQQYATLAGIAFDMRNIYVYYAATEFSRYIEHMRDGHHNGHSTDLAVIKQRIVRTMHLLEEYR